jgi:hypothetical protein
VTILNLSSILPGNNEGLLILICRIKSYIAPMIKHHLIKGNPEIAELENASIVISDSQDAIELINMPEAQECNKFIIYEKNLSSDFFNLSSGVAGEVLQKFSNYRIRLAIIGDFSKYKSKNLNDFFRESNKTGNILFLKTLEEALVRLS